MKQVRGTRTVLCVLVGTAAVVGAFALYVREIEPLANMFPAIDYTGTGAAEDLLFSIRRECPLGVVPPSARNPRIYRGAGKDPIYWEAFTVAPGDVGGIEAALAEAGYQRVPADTEVLPPVPDDIVSWWVPAGRDVTVWSASPDTERLTWFLIDQETGEVWLIDVTS